MSHVCPPWLSFILYNPVRKVLTDREKILDESGITAESVVLEIGAGNGFITEVIARRAKKVIAVELQNGMARKLRKRVHRFLDKVEIIAGDIASVTIGNEFADVCIMYYAFHEVSNKVKAAEYISSAVKKGGLLSIYEPTVEVNKELMQKTLKMFEHNGFKREIERDGRFTRFALLRKKDA